MTTIAPTTSAQNKLLQRPSLGSLALWGLLAAVLAGSWKGADIRPAALIADGGNMATYIASFFPPNFSDWRVYLQEMLVTVQIAVWGTVLAVICAVPLGLLSSTNIAPAWIYQPVRRLMDAARAINEMVFAMLFIVAVGLGPFAGVLALWVHTTGILAKLFSEAVDRLIRNRWKVSGQQVPMRWKKLSTASSRRCCPCGFRIRCTGLNRMCAPPRWWAWSVPAASVSFCGKSFAASSTRKPAP